jgi:O-antigen chain-terminating methyltransferase
MSSNQNSFYKSFEDQHRGSRELIKSRLSVYVPFIKKVQSVHPDAVALDLGCGRGEWLELLQDNQLSASGIDQDDGMLSACRSRGLNVQTGDAIAHLKSLPDDSLSIVSGFHIAEHLSLDDLQTLIKESLRILKPAGLLILEAPNTENLVVGTSSFYLDPTHQRPLPSSLLSFLAGHFGFARVKVLGLQESSNLTAPETTVSLFAVLSGVSPDYAVIAQKSGNTQEMSGFDEAFNTKYGLTLEDLAVRYQKQIDDCIRKAELSHLRLEKILKLINPLKWIKGSD